MLRLHISIHRYNAAVVSLLRMKKMCACDDCDKVVCIHEHNAKTFSTCRDNYRAVHVHKYACMIALGKFPSSGAV